MNEIYRIRIPINEKKKCVIGAFPEKTMDPRLKKRTSLYLWVIYSTSIM